MPVRVVTGFEFGTGAGIVTGNIGNKIMDARFGTGAANVVPVTTTPRNGTYCLALALSGSAAWTPDTLGASQNRGLIAFGLRYDSLPAGTMNIVRVDTTVVQLLISSTGVLSANVGGSAVSSSAISTGAWHWVELYFDISGATRTVDLWVDDVFVGQATGSGATTITSQIEFAGSTNNPAWLMDDLYIETDSADTISRPIGRHKVVMLSPDPAGTVTLSGTAGNFNTFTANGTLAAWNATTARNNIDEIPPTIGASADGFVQINLAGSDYVQVPMTSYALAQGEVVTAAEMRACGWATTTTGATIGFRSWNGSTETILFAVADANFDNSTTVPAWVCKMLTVADINTQAELDALEFRIGFSGDATPDIGIHTIYAEVAVKEGNPRPYLVMSRW